MWHFEKTWGCMVFVCAIGSTKFTIPVNFRYPRYALFIQRRNYIWVYIICTFSVLVNMEKNSLTSHIESENEWMMFYKKIKICQCRGRFFTGATFSGNSQYSGLGYQWKTRTNSDNPVVCKLLRTACWSQLCSYWATTVKNKICNIKESRPQNEHLQ